jgi:hypothetical protein
MLSDLCPKIVPSKKTAFSKAECSKEVHCPRRELEVQKREVLRRVSRQENAAKNGNCISDGQMTCNSERQIFSSDFQGDMGCKASDGI